MDAISLRHLPRRSIKNCELYSANVARQTDRLKTNYSVDYREHQAHRRQHPNLFSDIAMRVMFHIINVMFFQPCVLCNQCCVSSPVIVRIQVMLLHASPDIHVLFSICFNALIVHGFLPNPLTDTVLVPIVKDKTKNISDKGNYRPIALASVMSKVFEMSLRVKLESYLHSSDYQFGFKANHSTDLCIYTLKEVIDFYKSQSTSIYVCFMDASKAFDRMNHWLLFKKLIDRGMPLIFVRILMEWYTTQKACVRWGSVVSDCFFVTNGVRQGGILSHLLFNVYMDGLSSSLSNNTPTGCPIGGVVVNYIMYADLVIISPSVKGLQRLLDIYICAVYGQTHDILFNDDKTVCMPAKSSFYINTPAVFLNGRRLSFTSKYKYLGTLMTHDGSDEANMSRQRGFFYARSNGLSKNFNACSPSVKATLFRTFCSNMYCGHLWHDFRKSALRKLIVGYNHYSSLIVYPALWRCGVNMVLP